MSVVKGYSLEELARLGRKRFEEIRDQFSDEDKGKFLAIDIETGEYVMDNDEIEARRRLREIKPDGMSWVERIGFRALRTMGGRIL
jgi:hypothetical protein